MGIVGNEMADVLAKQALKQENYGGIVKQKLKH